MPYYFFISYDQNKCSKQNIDQINILVIASRLKSVREDMNFIANSHANEIVFQNNKSFIVKDSKFS